MIFCVYHETEERTLRAKVDEFEIATRRAYEWAIFDPVRLHTFADWLSSQRYAVSYFRQPASFPHCCPNTLPSSPTRFQSFLIGEGIGSDHVVALKGVGSLFGFLKVKDVVEKLAPMVKGRLVVFFPGSCENNNYRLLDGYDGWNYLAVPITADKEY